MTFDLQDLEDGTYFVRHDGAYLKTGTTKEDGAYILCHPISAGRFGDIVQFKLNVWLPKREGVKLRCPTEEPKK